MFFFKSKQERNWEKLKKNIMEAHKMVFNDPKRAELVEAIMGATNVPSDDITLDEALAILVAYHVNWSSGGGFETGSAQWEAFIAFVISIEFNHALQPSEKMSADRAKELAKRCNYLFVNILRKQA